MKVARPVREGAVGVPRQKQLRRKYEKGQSRRRLPEYDCILKQRRYWLKKTGGVFTPHIKELTKRMRSLAACRSTSSNCCP